MTKQAIQLPELYLDLLTEKKAFGHLATKYPDGTLQSTPVWVDYDGTNVIVNTSTDRQKAHNMKQHPRVALSVHDPDDPYRYLEVRGEVIDSTTDSADEHINKLSKKYLGKDEFPYREPGQQRIKFLIRPLDYSTH